MNFNRLPSPDDITSPPERDRYDPVALASYLTRCVPMVYIRETKELLHYQNGMYRPGGEDMITCYLAERLGDQYRSSRDRDVRRLIEASTAISITEFCEPANMIPMIDGYYDLEDNNIHPYDGKQYFRAVIPAHWDTLAECKNFDDFLKSIVRDDQIDLVWEMIGACLYRGIPAQVAFFLLGGGRNGKGVFIEVLQKILGDYCTDIELLDLSRGKHGDRFAVAELHGKSAAFCGDMSHFALNDLSDFKKVVGGDSLKAQRKYGQPFTYCPYATLIMACNEFPKIREDTDAIHRRIRQIHFPYTFDENNPNTKPRQELIDELTTQSEIDGIIYHAISSLRDVLERGDYCVPVNIEDQRDANKRAANPVYAFWQDMIVTDGNASADTDDTLSAYVHYCLEYQLPYSVSKGSLTSKLKQLDTNVRVRRLSKGRSVYDGIRLLSWEEHLDRKADDYEDEPEGKATYKTPDEIIADVMNEDEEMNDWRQKDMNDWENEADEAWDSEQDEINKLVSHVRWCD